LNKWNKLYKTDPKDYKADKIMTWWI